MGKILAIVMILHPQQIRITQLGSFDDIQSCMRFMQSVIHDQKLEGTAACIPAQSMADWLQQMFGRQA